MKIYKLFILGLLLTVTSTLGFALEPWGLVKVAVGHVRSGAGHANEMVTQATMGTPMKLLAEQSDWYKVELPDGYTGWMSRWSVEPMSQKRFDRWRKAERVVVLGNGHRTTTDMISEDGLVPVSDLDRLDILEVVGPADGNALIVKTPDGREGIVPADEVEDMDLFFKRNIEGPIVPDADTILKNAYDMLGRVYLWGGTSFKMTDCSGLTRICYMMDGILLPRDARPQSNVGRKVTLAEAQPGDLVFFANSAGRVNHVGIYMGDNKIIHSSGQVYIKELGKNYHSIVRIDNSDIPGVKKIADHPWYFL